MSKKAAYTIDPHIGSRGSRPAWERTHGPEMPNEPLSGSKKVKNRQHSRNNHGEGS